MADNVTSGTEPNAPETAAEQPKKGFFAKRKERPKRRERRKLWKAEKKRCKAEVKEHYRYAPLRTRIWNLYLRKPVVALSIIGLVLYVLSPALIDIGTSVFSAVIGLVYDTRTTEVTKEEIYELSPIDEEGAARIDAFDPVDKDDTWTICVYLVGSNLEDDDENDLSTTVRMQIADQAAQVASDNGTRLKGQLAQFTEELDASGLGLPNYLFNPKKPEKSETKEKGPDYVSTMEGSASVDIGEMTSDVWSDNINIVIQTGGATRWSNQAVNPNRTQRFLYKGGVFKEVDNLPLQPSSVPQTLSSFLEFCRDEYPADHTMLVLWNHGGGAFGYGNDSIYGNSLSLKDIRTALSDVYEPNSSDPAFDIIGFDACLMSSLEVTHALDGFADYYVLSEETEPGDGWDYAPWLKAMSDDPTMSPARVCREIADAYMDYYMTSNINVGFLITNDVTFAVLDATKAEELYDAYCELAKAQLTDATRDLSVLSEMGRCADKSTHCVASVYELYNTIDLGNYVDLTVDSYPEQSSKVKELIGETVLYHRESGSLSDAQGISVYLPGTVKTIDGLVFALKYINEVCDDEATKALYYYKVAGALNDELAEYAKSLTGEEPKKLDTKPFDALSKPRPELDGEVFRIPIDQTLTDMLQGYSFELAQFDQDAGTMTYYGRDEFLTLDGDGTLDVCFDGEWVYFGGQPLAVEIVSSSASVVDYRSKVKIGSQVKYLEFSFDRDTEQFSLKGVREISSSLIGGDTPTINVFANSKTLTELKPGTRITPLYETVNLVDNTKEDVEGTIFEFKRTTKLELKGLKDGYYVGAGVITDIRGDEYYSQVMGYTMRGGTVSDRAVDDNFFGSTY